MKQLALDIPEPCHEDWNGMTPVEKGKFCGSCQKEVIDFTQMSDAQLVAFFKRPLSGSLCGRFIGDQLGRRIDMPGKRIPWVKYFFQIAIPAFLLSSKGIAQGTPRIIIGDTILPPQKEHTLSYGKVMLADGPPFSIRGKVIDENGEPIPYASITVKETGRGLSVDSTGGFVLTDAYIGRGAFVEFSSAGFQSKELFFSADSSSEQEIHIQLASLPSLSNVVVKSYANNRDVEIMAGGLSIIIKSANEWEMEKRVYPKEYSLKVSPNPVVMGSSVSIDCRKLKEGYYVLQLLSLTGQTVLVRTVWIDKSAATVNFPLPFVATGNYFIKMVYQASGKNYSAKIVVR